MSLNNNDSLWEKKSMQIIKDKVTLKSKKISYPEFEEQIFEDNIQDMFDMLPPYFGSPKNLEKSFFRTIDHDEEELEKFNLHIES